MPIKDQDEILLEMKAYVESFCDDVVEPKKDFPQLEGFKLVEAKESNAEYTKGLKPCIWPMLIYAQRDSFEECCKEVWDQLEKLKYLKPIEKLYWRVQPVFIDEKHFELDDKVFTLKMRFTLGWPTLEVDKNAN